MRSEFMSRVRTHSASLSFLKFSVKVVRHTERNLAVEKCGGLRGRAGLGEGFSAVPTGLGSLFGWLTPDLRPGLNYFAALRLGDLGSDALVRPALAAYVKPRRLHCALQVISTRMGISFFTGMVRSEGGSILKSARVAGMVPEMRVSSPCLTTSKAIC